MRFLRRYTLLAALAVAGVCFASQDADADSILSPIYGAHYFGDYYYGSPINPWGGAEFLPPAPYIVNGPLRSFDNGYNPTYYWNRPHFYGPAAYGPPPCPCRSPHPPIGYHWHHRHHPHRTPMNPADRSTPP